MTKLMFDKSGMFLEEIEDEEIIRTELPVKHISSMNIKEINPKGYINVDLTLMTDEIDINYSSISEYRKAKDEESRDKLRQEPHNIFYTIFKAIFHK